VPAINAFRECLLPLRGPERQGLVALIALELVRHPEHRSVDRRPIIDGQFDNANLDDEVA